MTSVSTQWVTFLSSTMRFRKGVFDKNYKATIGVDFEMERFEVLGVPFSLQLWVQNAKVPPEKSVAASSD